MAEKPGNNQELIDTYRQKAPGYDLSVGQFDNFTRVGFNRSGWRKAAVSELGLKAGDTVVNIGCSTGLNFRLLSQVKYIHHGLFMRMLC